MIYYNIVHANTKLSMMLRQSICTYSPFVTHYSRYNGSLFIRWQRFLTTLTTLLDNADNAPWQRWQRGQRSLTTRTTLLGNADNAPWQRWQHTSDISQAIRRRYYTILHKYLLFKRVWIHKCIIALFVQRWMCQYRTSRAIIILYTFQLSRLIPLRQQTFV